MTQQWRLFLCAVQFLTRLPTPRQAEWSPDWLGRSAKYFPLVGLLVGGLSALVLLATRLIWPSGVLPALFAVGAGVVITGALHEDGLADTADGLGGGQSAARRLEIMKDSRLGNYGALALGLVLAIKVAALAALAPGLKAGAVLVCAHAGGRAVAVVAMALLPYARDPQASKLNPVARGVHGWEVGAALLTAAIPTGLLMGPGAGAVCTFAAALAALIPAAAARRLVGGHTGDVLGAVEQAFEMAFIVAAAALPGMGWLPR